METDKQHQGEPVAWLYRDPDGNARDQLTSDRASNEDRGGWLEIPLYTHADPGVVERLRADVETMRRKNNEYWHETETLRAQLAELEKQRIRLRDNNVEALKENMALQQKLVERDAQLVKANYVIDHARTIDKQAFARGTQNVDHGLFRGLGNLLAQYDEALSASTEPSKSAGPKT